MATSSTSGTGCKSTFLDKMKQLRQAKVNRRKDHVQVPIIKDFNQAVGPAIAEFSHHPKILAWTDERIEPYSGFRVSNRSISVKDMHARMRHWPIHPIHKIKAPSVHNSVTGNWVTIVVIWEVGSIQKSKNDQSYRSFKLTDLKENNLNLILFGSDAEFKTDQDQLKNGHIIAILNPGFLKPTEYRPWSLYAPVDRSKCNLCAHHLEASFRQFKASRMEFATGTTGMNFIDPMTKKASGLKTHERTRHGFEVKSNQRSGFRAFDSPTMYRTDEGVMVETNKPVTAAPPPLAKRKDGPTSDAESHDPILEFFNDQNDTGAQYLREIKKRKKV
ncbi:hypothetical protein H4R33_005742 [Dimargaris cristalligena]|nr:hypothetical protein H4R33_005742 [Dimargaris cristalligena]